MLLHTHNLSASHTVLHLTHKAGLDHILQAQRYAKRKL
jgi:hypothetical protein